MPHMFETHWTRIFDFDRFTRDHAERSQPPEHATPHGQASRAGNAPCACDTDDTDSNPTHGGPPCSH